MQKGAHSANKKTKMNKKKMNKKTKRKIRNKLLKVFIKNQKYICRISNGDRMQFCIDFGFWAKSKKFGGRGQRYFSDLRREIGMFVTGNGIRSLWAKIWTMVLVWDIISSYGSIWAFGFGII